MIKGGYYLKARCIQNSDISRSAPYVREIWDWILKEANYTDTSVCKKGQCVRTYKDITDGLSWVIGWRKMTYSKAQCENAMKWLRKHTMITTMKTTRGIVITVLNYDKYQNPDNYDNHRRATTITTIEPQTCPTINNKDNKIKKYNKGIEESTLTNKYPTLESVKESDFEYISSKYQIPLAFVKSKYDDLVNWHEKNPQKNHYKNYYAGLRDWVKRDALKIKGDYAKQNQYRGIDASNI